MRHWTESYLDKIEEFGYGPGTFFKIVVPSHKVEEEMKEHQDAFLILKALAKMEASQLEANVYSTLELEVAQVIKFSIDATEWTLSDIGMYRNALLFLDKNDKGLLDKFSLLEARLQDLYEQGDSLGARDLFVDVFI